MLIAAIVSLIVLILLCAFLDIYFLLIEKKNYEVITRHDASTIVAMHLPFILCGPVMLSVAIYAYASQGVNNGNVPLLYVGATAGLIMLCFLYPFLSYFDGIRDNTIYARRFFKIRLINIKDIRTIDEYFDGSFLITEINGFTLTIGRTIQHREAFLKLLNERKGNTFSLNPNIETNVKNILKSMDDYDERETQILTDIGKRYRENYRSYRKKQIIKLSVITSIIFAGWLAGSIAITLLYFKDLIGQVLLGLCIFSIIVYAICFKKYLDRLEKQLQQDDRWLGYIYRFKDKRVVGTAKKKRNLRLALSTSLLGFSVLTSITTWFDGVMPNYSDKGAIIAFWICIGLIPVSLIFALVSFIIFKKDSKSETIIL